VTSMMYLTSRYEAVGVFLVSSLVVFLNFVIGILAYFCLDEHYSFIV
jgi:hypothetical protein